MEIIYIDYSVQIDCENYEYLQSLVQFGLKLAKYYKFDSSFKTHTSLFNNIELNCSQNLKLA